MGSFLGHCNCIWVSYGVPRALLARASGGGVEGGRCWDGPGSVNCVVLGRDMLMSGKTASWHLPHLCGLGGTACEQFRETRSIMYVEIGSGSMYV